MERSKVNVTVYPVNVLMESISAQMSLQRNAYTRTFKLLPLHHPGHDYLVHLTYRLVYELSGTS